MKSKLVELRKMVRDTKLMIIEMITMLKAFFFVMVLYIVHMRYKVIDFPKKIEH